MRRLPRLTLLLVLSSGVLSLAAPVLAFAYAAYARGQILQGELWRLFSGHLLHYSPAHFVSDAAAFAVLATIVEWRLGWLKLLQLVLLLMSAISVGLLVTVPTMHYYAGLSGVNYGLLVVASAQVLTPALAHKRVGQWLPWVFNTLLLSWIIAQRYHQQAQSLANPQLVQLAWQAHLVGALTALLLTAQGHNRLGFPGPRGQHNAERMPL
jgi:rhomboid family GlyGly-CTERM serine protease